MKAAIITEVNFILTGGCYVVNVDLRGWVPEKADGGFESKSSCSDLVVEGNLKHMRGMDVFIHGERRDLNCSATAFTGT